MTSKERRQARYIRSVARRRYRMEHPKPGPDNFETKFRRTGGRYKFDPRKERKPAKWILRVADSDCFEKVFSFGHLWTSYQLCCRGVGFKPSTQSLKFRAPMELNKAHRKLIKGVWRAGKLHIFYTCERGKLRRISAQHIRDRIVHRCASDYAYTPRLSRSFIYDNGASMEGKGQHFALDRCVTHLHQFYREWGNDGYILTYDFSKFFESVSHENVMNIIRKAFTDQKIIDFTEQFLSSFGSVGVGLGSCVSQVIALASANSLDHMIKEHLGIRYYGRYMDDGYLIHPTKEHLQYCLRRIREKCKELGITLNEKKTQIIKLSHGFTFLKARMYLTETGKVVKKIYKKSVTRMRRKLKKLRNFVDKGLRTEESVYNTYISWRKGYAAKYDAIQTIRSMDKLYCKLYTFRPPTLLKEAA